VFVDTQDSRTRSILSLSRLQLQELLIPTLDGGAAQPFPLGQGFLRNAVMVVREDLPTEGLRGSAPSAYPWKSLIEVPSASLAAILPSLQKEIARTHPQIRVPKPTHESVLPSKLQTFAERAAHRPSVPDREDNPLDSFHPKDFISWKS
jgi:hypothetical protein